MSSFKEEYPIHSEHTHMYPIFMILKIHGSYSYIVLFITNRCCQGWSHDPYQHRQLHPTIQHTPIHRYTYVRIHVYVHVNEQVSIQAKYHALNFMSEVQTDSTA
jgi:hypothetical protein